MLIQILFAFPCNRKTWRCPILCTLLIGVLFTNVHAQTQRKQLTPNTTVQKIAFIDHSRLRSQYNALQQARDSVRLGWQELQKQKSLSEADKKAWHQKKMGALQKYELKIIAAIDGVVSKGGFTDVKPIEDSSGQKGVDITNLVLQKLNSKN